MYDTTNNCCLWDKVLDFHIGKSYFTNPILIDINHIPNPCTGRTTFVPMTTCSNLSSGVDVAVTNYQ